MAKAERVSTRTRRWGPATLCSLACVLDGILARTWIGARIDRGALDALAQRRYSVPWHLAFSVNSDLPAWLAAATLIACRVVWARWGARRAIAVALCPALSALLADGVKHAGVVKSSARILASSAPSSWPSGHAAAMAGLLGSLLLIPGPRILRRRLAWAGSGLLVLGCLSLFATRSHRPTDVLAGLLLGGAIASAVAACAGSARRI